MLPYKLFPDPRRLPGAEFLPIKRITGRTRFSFVEGSTTKGGVAVVFLVVLGDAGFDD